MITRRAITASAMMASTAVVLLPSPDPVRPNPALPGPLWSRTAPGRSPGRVARLLQGVADDGGGAVHLHDPHPRTDGEGLSVVLAAGRPLVGTEFDPPTGVVDGAGHRRGAADQRLGPVELHDRQSVV